MLKTLQEGRGELVQRAFFGGAYLAFLVFLFLVFPAEGQSAPLVPMSFFPILVIPGMILAHVSYELCLPVVRRVAKRRMLSGFTKAAGDSGLDFSGDFDTLRRWRNSYLNKSSENNGYYKRRILQSMNVRRILVYLFACSVTGVAISILGVVAYSGRLSVGLTGCILSVFLAVSTLHGAANRYHIIGELVGNAYLYEIKKEPGKEVT